MAWEKVKAFAAKCVEEKQKEMKREQNKRKREEEDHKKREEEQQYKTHEVCSEEAPQSEKQKHEEQVIKLKPIKEEQVVKGLMIVH